MDRTERYAVGEGDKVINLDDLRKQVSMLTDEALLEVHRGDLVDAAREVYEAEAAGRGIAWAADESE